MLLKTSKIECVQYFEYWFFMHGMSIYEIKRICHHAQVLVISYESFQRLTSYVNK